MFRPALTLAVDDAERRWIAEIGNQDLPGPIWCVFPHPEVAVYVSDDLAAFLRVLRERTCRGEVGAWLRDLATQASSVWSRRHALAIRPHQAYRLDRAIRGWLMTLPSDAYVYDLRAHTEARGWPYGVVGPSGRHYRCGRELIFAVAGLPAQGWRVPHPRAGIPLGPANAEVSFAIETARGQPRPRITPERPTLSTLSGRTSSNPPSPLLQRAQTMALVLRPCA